MPAVIAMPTAMPSEETRVRPGFLIRRRMLSLMSFHMPHIVHRSVPEELLEQDGRDPGFLARRLDFRFG